MQAKLSGGLFGMLGALIVLLVVELCKPSAQTIGTVDITGMTHAFIKKYQEQQLSKEALQRETLFFSSALEKTIKQFAATHHLVLLPKEAVMAGSEDYTREINALVSRILSKEENKS